jgi:hypothetical protein
MNQHKWQIGPVKLASGEEARIDAINEGQEAYRYTGRIRNFQGDWIASGWRSNGRYMHGGKDHERNLAPPPKKTVRVQVWLMVWPNHAIAVFYNENDAISNAKKHGFALIPIDREVTEGEGL